MVSRIETDTTRVRVHSTEVASDHPAIVEWNLANASCHGAHVVRKCLWRRCWSKRHGRVAHREGAARIKDRCCRCRCWITNTVRLCMSMSVNLVVQRQLLHLMSLLHELRILWLGLLYLMLECLRRLCLLHLRELDLLHLMCLLHLL
jgi:hypothetical protein